MDPRSDFNRDSRLFGEMDLFGILLIILLFLGLISTVAGLILKRFNHKKRQATSRMKWAENELYSSKNSKNEGFEVNDFVDDNFTLPMLLRLRKEMMFPKESIEKKQQIGSGKFGVVFKGTLDLGNAKCVYKNDILI